MNLELYIFKVDNICRVVIPDELAFKPAYNEWKNRPVFVIDFFDM